MAVVGAGVAGAMAAYRLKAAGLKPLVFEAGDYIGGRARTLRKSGFIFDTGAVGLLGSYNRTRDVAREIGMGSQFLTIKPVGAIPRDGVLRYLDMARPIRSFLSSELFSVRSKFKMLKMVRDVVKLRNNLDYEQIDALIPHDVESVEEYSLRELNEEIYEYLTGTLTRGAWLAAADQASVIQFFWTAKNFTPHMYSLMGGMSSLPETLLKGTEVLLNTHVVDVHEGKQGVSVTYVNQSGETTRPFEACVIATEPKPATKIFPQMIEGQKTYLNTIEYSRSVNVHFGLSAKPDHPEMYIMMPKRECPDITTVFLDHLKAPDRAPPGKGMISVFLRSDWCDERFDTEDNVVLKEVIAKLRPFFGDISSSVEESMVQRWDYCALKVKPGNARLMSEYNRAIDPQARVQIAGDFAPFSSVNTAVVSGERAAKRVVEKLHA
ncbi:MAG: hemY 1 [Hydrocarboniphaga sp.]|nr:hemY 1 [Hydrocarboniphaga sp.]